MYKMFFYSNESQRKNATVKFKKYLQKCYHKIPLSCTCMYNIFDLHTLIRLMLLSMWYSVYWRCKDIFAVIFLEM